MQQNLYFHVQGFEYPAQGVEGDVGWVALQFADLGLLHAEPFAELVLSEVVAQAVLADGFGEEFQGHPVFAFGALGGARRAEQLVFEVVEGGELEGES